MQTKLTLRLDDALINSAKKYARHHGKSVSQMVADYFALLDKKTVPREEEESTPMLKSLRGVLKGKVAEQDYRSYLEQKHLGDDGI